MASRVCYIIPPGSAGCGTNPSCTNPAPNVECWTTDEHVSVPMPPGPTPPDDERRADSDGQSQDGYGQEGQGQGGGQNRGGSQNEGNGNGDGTGNSTGAEAAAAGVQAGRDMLRVQLNSLLTKSTEGLSPCSTGYVDFNFTFTPEGFGVTGGIQVTENRVHLYAG
jgi:hypothetical protein